MFKNIPIKLEIWIPTSDGGELYYGKDLIDPIQIKEYSQKWSQKGYRLKEIRLTQTELKELKINWYRRLEYRLNVVEWPQRFWYIGVVVSFFVGYYSNSSNSNESKDKSQESTQQQQPIQAPEHKPSDLVLDSVHPKQIPIVNDSAKKVKILPN